MKKTYQFIEGATRYEADDILLDQGFCQVDTAQDFSGYGNWVQLHDLKAVTFAEGDLTQFQFNDPSELRNWLDGLIDIKHIDCGIRGREENLARAKELGIADLAA